MTISSEYTKKYRALHKKEISHYAKKYYILHQKELLKQGKEYYKKFPEKFWIKKLKKYGLTIDSYNKIFAAQKGKCIICGNTNKNKKRLFVDHNHTTGKIRGLLCYKCNTTLGNVQDNIEMLEKTIVYLKNNK